MVRTVYLLSAIWNPPFEEDGSIREDIGIYSSLAAAENQWKICTADNDDWESYRFNQAEAAIEEFELDRLMYT